jgi:hypothetical protein
MVLEPYEVYHLCSAGTMAANAHVTKNAEA